MTTRIREGDALAELYQELLAQGVRLKPWECDEREAWFDHCRQLLAAVQDQAQRISWLVKLSQAFQLTMPGTPLEVVMRQLWKDQP